mgnify:CR=1 FL=1
MIILSLGSNLTSPDGKLNRFENIDSAIKIFLSHNYEIIKKSSYYETPSYPDKKNPKFINIVIKIKTLLSPVELLTLIISIEKKIERKRRSKRSAKKRGKWRRNDDRWRQRRRKMPRNVCAYKVV